jgi:hypothetical protein
MGGWNLMASQKFDLQRRSTILFSRHTGMHGLTHKKDTASCISEVLLSRIY